MHITPAIVDNRTSRSDSRLRSGRLQSRLAVALAATAIGTATAAAPAIAMTSPPDASGNYAFQTLNNAHDETFNQLLGINENGKIVGYFGSGQAGHPNKGYRLLPPYGQGDYINENFPGSAQTQVTALNNHGVTVGFWVNGKGANHGFYAINGRHFRQVNFPTANNAKPQVDQLLGINDSDIAVGFYTDSHGSNHGYSYNIRRHRFRSINVSGDSNVTAAAINDRGDVAGFATNSAGTTEAFLKQPNGRLIRLNYPGASATQAFGVNNGNEVVGQYTVGTGNSATTHGFVWLRGLGFENVDDPNGIGATTINGVNDRGDLVGFYTDSNGNTDGLLATPQG
jgi:probable HAF family extracellular repeat protein